MVLSLRQHEPVLRTLGATTVVGIVLGSLVGGIGSRLAMRALFLTSDPSVRGVISDDGFRIGEFSVATVNLMIVGTLIGIVGAFVYLAVRPFLIGPRWLHSLTCCLAAGAVIGSLLVHPEGVDFTSLSPTWFAIALFVAIPALFGAVTPPVTEWILRKGGWAQTAPLRWVASPLLVFLFPPLLAVVGVPVAGVLGVRFALGRLPRIQRYARHGAAMWSVRVAWLAVAVLGLVGLADDLVALL